MHFYSLSTDLNPYWNKSHGMQPEIQAYWKHLAEKYSLLRHTAFNSQVVSADWDAEEQLYHLVIQDVVSGDMTSTTAQIVISAIGILEVPRYPPNMPGISTFKGASFHSARWNREVELHGKRVAVIGNGASAYVD